MFRRAPSSPLIGVSVSTIALASCLASCRDGASTVSALAESEAQAEPAATEASPAPAPGDPDRVVLENPGLAGWRPEFPGEKPRWRTRPSPGFDRLALPTGFFIALYDRLEKPRHTIGRVRRGAALSVRKADTSITCFDNGQRGAWYEVEGGGYLCSTSGFELVGQAEPLDPPQRNPRMDRPMPFDYARVVSEGTPRIARPFTLADWERLASIGGPKDDPSGLMVERMIGDFFLSLDDEVDVGGMPFMRTVHNEFADRTALKPREEPPMRGERLGKNNRLPIAFVWGEETTPVRCAGGDAVCGVAERHARFHPKGTREVDGATYYVGPGDVLVPASAVRLAEPMGKRPGGVGPTDKWVHIDLARQTLIAYEGDTPVYATLVSSGKEGHDTPTGLYRVQRKYVTKTMRAYDEVEGLYHIEDIPFTMYYYGAYALHGAFWHDVFGQVRSHGCTNLPPADARWLFYWSEPDLPAGWHARENIQRGLAVYFSN